MSATATPPLVAKARPANTESAVGQAVLTSHMPALDGLRGLAISLVLVTHCETALKWNQHSDLLVKALNKIVCYSTCGVDLFFVLSGFLITGILLRSRESKNYFRSFYVRRALRIFPLYYGVLFLIFCLTSTLGEPRDGLMGSPSSRAWLWTYGTNILMTIRHNWTYASLNHFWSLAVEEHFYLVWPFLVIAMRLKPLVWLCVASVPLSMLVRSVFVYPLHNELAAYVLTICRVDSLLVGCFIAFVAHSGRLDKLIKPSKAVVLAMALVIPAFICCITHASNTDRIIGPTIFGLFFGALLVLTLTQPKLSNVFENRSLRVLGKYSYGIYVYHFIIIVGLEQIWNWTAMPSIVNYIVFFAVASSASFAIAMLSYQLYEVHFLKLKRFFQA